jgi:hypothetical protein
MAQQQLPSSSWLRDSDWHERQRHIIAALIFPLDEESLAELISRGTKTSCRDALNTKS